MANNREIINKIFDYVENGDIDKAVFACVRLSRSIGDVFNTVIFLRELYTDDDQLSRAILDETNNFEEKARKFIWETSREYWLKGRELRTAITDNPDEILFISGVGEMQKEITSLEEKISRLKTPPGMAPLDTAAFTDKYDNLKSRLGLKIMSINIIKERIRARCMDYASRIEKQMDMQEKTNSFLEEVQNSVNCYFSSKSDDIFRKLQKATNLLGSNNPEDNALLLTAIRRTIKSVADYFYPPKSGNVVCHDGKERKMGEEEYLNRLHEFCCITFKSSKSNELIKAEASYLMVFARKLNEIASKGVHAEVTPSEAKQGLVGLYLFLSNVIEKLRTKTTESTPNTY